jgi:hypothetical protein
VTKLFLNRPLRPVQRVAAPTLRFAVPGWTDVETRQWLYNGSAASGLAIQLPFVRFSESMGNHDSNIVDADSVD